jgi:hypothetical protein
MQPHYVIRKVFTAEQENDLSNYINTQQNVLRFIDNGNASASF